MTLMCLVDGSENYYSTCISSYSEQPKLQWYTVNTMKISANKIYDEGKKGHYTVDLTLVRYFSLSLQMLIAMT